LGDLSKSIFEALPTVRNDVTIEFIIYEMTPLRLLEGCKGSQVYEINPKDMFFKERWSKPILLVFAIK
jgi:hypothetical protein